MGPGWCSTTTTPTSSSSRTARRSSPATSCSTSSTGARRDSPARHPKVRPVTDRDGSGGKAEQPARGVERDFDWLVIGSGFGGSVAALRLAEKGYRVGVLECGRRFADEDFAETTWQMRRYYWMPKLGLKGIFRLTMF